MVQIRAPVLGDANHVARPFSPRDIDEETVPGFFGQKAETDGLAAGWCCAHLRKMMNYEL